LVEDTKISDRKEEKYEKTFAAKRLIDEIDQLKSKLEK
jgi:hypothetical protein